MGHVACIGEKRNVYGVVFGKHAGMRMLGRPACRWQDMKWELKWDWSVWTQFI
jgi:hypothetical protein